MYLTVSWSKGLTWNITARGTALEIAFSLINISYLRKSPLGWLRVTNFPGPCKELIRLVWAWYCGRDNSHLPRVQRWRARRPCTLCQLCSIDYTDRGRLSSPSSAYCSDKLVLVQLKSHGIVVDGSSG